MSSQIKTLLLSYDAVVQTVWTRGLKIIENTF